MRHSRRIASGLVFANLLGMLAVTPTLGGPSLRSLSQRLNLTSRKIQSVQKELRRTKQQQRTAAEQLAYAERRLATTKSTLADTRAQLRETRNKLAATQVKLDEVEARLKERNALLGERLADTYKQGSVSYLSVLLGATDFWDLLSRGYLIRKILNSDVELIEAIKEDKAAIEELKAALEEQERLRVALEEKQETLVAQAAKDKAERERLVADIRQDRVKYEQMLAALEADSRSISDMISALQRTPEGKKRLAQKWTGSFIKPVDGRITSPFGMRHHPILKRRSMHTGVDIAAPYGTPIKAAAAGEVVFTGWRKAYGNTIVIDHGGGVITFYAHCSSFIARTGMRVSQGQAIARVGSTGLSTGNHVHFEVQKNGTPVKPF